MDNVRSDSLSSTSTNPFTVNEELSFEDAWVRVAELLHCSQVLAEPVAAPQRAVMHLVDMAKMVAERAVECMRPA
ncbi:hypothetical protein [Pseudomonas poae]|uniref:hypothetical protein n=1 Tax=Pseudomonas poae TaxID=200451 RepID=UPI0034D6C375